MSLLFEMDYQDFLACPFWKLKEQAFFRAEQRYHKLLLMIDANNIAELSKQKLNDALDNWRERIMEQQPLTEEQMMERKRQINREAFRG